MPTSEQPSSIERLLSDHRRIALDSNVLIYLVDTVGARYDAAASIVDAIESGRIDGVLSTVGLVEILTGPARHGDGAAFEMLANELRSLRLEIVPLLTGTAEDAAWVRGRASLDLGDSYPPCHGACGRGDRVHHERSTPSVDERPRGRLPR